MLVVRLLGPLEVVRDGAPVNLRGRKQRLLLTVLAVRAGESVSADALGEVLWGDEARTTGLHALEVQISRLRRVLEPEGSAGHWQLLQATGEALWMLDLDRGPPPDPRARLAVRAQLAGSQPPSERRIGPLEAECLDLVEQRRRPHVRVIGETLAEVWHELIERMAQPAGARPARGCR